MAISVGDLRTMPLEMLMEMHQAVTAELGERGIPTADSPLTVAQLSTEMLEQTIAHAMAEIERRAPCDDHGRPSPYSVN